MNLIHQCIIQYQSFSMRTSKPDQSGRPPSSLLRWAAHMYSFSLLRRPWSMVYDLDPQNLLRPLSPFFFFVFFFFFLFCLFCLFFLLLFFCCCFFSLFFLFYFISFYFFIFLFFIFIFFFFFFLFFVVFFFFFVTKIRKYDALANELAKCHFSLSEAMPRPKP